MAVYHSQPQSSSTHDGTGVEQMVWHLGIEASFAARLGVEIGCLLGTHESRVLFSLPARPRLKEEDWFDEIASHDSFRTKGYSQESKMALSFHRLLRSTSANSLFCRTGPSFLPLLRSLKVQNVFSTSADLSEVQSTGHEEKRDLRTVDTSIRRLHVGNLLKGKDYTTEDTVFKYFSQYGEIEKLEYFRHKLTNFPRGFAFVTFRDAKSAQKVLARADSHIIDGHNVTVDIPLKMAKPAERQKKELTVLVNKISENVCKKEIEDHFSQFGEVNKVFLAQKDPKGENLCSYYVMFRSLSAVKKALEQPTQKIANQDIDAQVVEFPRKPKEFSGKTKCISITSVPDDLTVENFRDYFEKFGVVECVDFIVHGGNASYSFDKDANVAFVRFPHEDIVDGILENKFHIINGSEVKVSRYHDPSNLASARLRELKLSVEGLPLATRPMAVQEYFEKTFGVVPNGVFLNQHRVLVDKKLICIVRFSDKREVERVLKEQRGTFHGHPLYFRRLVWKKESTEVTAQQ